MTSDGNLLILNVYGSNLTLDDIHIGSIKIVTLNEIALVLLERPNIPLDDICVLE